MDLPYSLEELKAATWDLIGANELPECYLRPIAFSGYGSSASRSRDNPVDVAIMAWPWGAYLGEEGLRNGIRVKVSSWQRVGPNVIPHVAKATGVYINSMLAVGEANRAGYDEAILLTAEGTSPTARARASSSSATASSTRPTCPPRSSSGSRATRSSRSRRISATASSRSR